MIIDRLPIRLYWFHMQGYARKNDTRVELGCAPHLPGLEIVGIDYAPNIVAMVMPKHYGWRDLQPHEIAQTIDLLNRITSGASQCR